MRRGTVRHLAACARAVKAEMPRVSLARCAEQAVFRHSLLDAATKRAEQTLRVIDHLRRQA